MTEIDTYPPHVRTMVGEENRRARSVLRTFLIEDFITPQTVGAEIGVAWGDFSKRLLEVANPQHLYLIDPWFECGATNLYKNHGHWKFGQTQEAFDNVYETVVQRFQKEMETGQVTILRKPSMEAAEFFEDFQRKMVTQINRFSRANPPLRLKLRLLMKGIENGQNSTITIKGAKKNEDYPQKYLTEDKHKTPEKICKKYWKEGG